jgi:hypothetical protein
MWAKDPGQVLFQTMTAYILTLEVLGFLYPLYAKIKKIFSYLLTTTGTI